MNSRELRSLEEATAALAPFAEMFSRTEEEVRRLQAIHPDHDYQFAGHRWREVLAGSVVPTAFRDAHSLLSSRTEGPAPTPTPKGLERWEITDEMVQTATETFWKTYYGKGEMDSKGSMRSALSAIRRSVEEALVAAHALRAPLGGEG